MRNLDIMLPVPFDEQQIAHYYQQAENPIEQSHWHILLLLVQGNSAREVIEQTHYSPRWVYEVARRYEMVQMSKEHVLARQMGSTSDAFSSCESCTLLYYRIRVTTDGNGIIICR